MKAGKSCESGRKKIATYTVESLQVSEQNKKKVFLLYDKSSPHGEKGNSKSFFFVFF